ncbi:MAG TPA: HK97 gp10 family phage protein [Candidatus Bathyarchaeota archaeon]|nr:HK97 gp10 family phage protein [Candidatus Bathyarchaeota archaeon]
MAIDINIDVTGAEEFKAAMERLDSGLQRQVHEWLANWAADVKESARQRVPVKTGQLRNSIYSEISEWVAEVGAEATYAMFVELGTRYMRARPFLFPAVQEALPKLEAIVCEAIEAAKREAGLCVSVR